MMRAAMIAVIGLVTVASAAPARDPVTAATNAMAEAEFDKALALLDSALPKTTKPAEIARLQLLRGEALVALQRLDEATQAFAAALVANPLAQLDPASASPDAVSTMARARRQILSELTVLIAGAQSANVKLDEVEMGPAPLKIRAGGGKHRLEAVAGNGARVTREIEIVPGKPMEVTLELPATMTPPPPPPPTPLAAATTEPAPPPGVTTSRPAPAPRRSGPKVAFIPIGLGVVALGVGAGLAVDSASTYGGLKKSLSDGTPPADFAQRVASGRTEQTIGFVVGGVGAAAVVAGALWYLLGSSSPSVAVYGTASGAGFSAAWELP